MMYTASLKLDRLSVDPKSPYGVNRDGPYSKQCLCFIHSLYRNRIAMGAENTLICYGCLYDIQIGIFRIPEYRIRKMNGNSGCFPVILSNFNHAPRFRHSFFLRLTFLPQFHLYFHHMVLQCLISDLHLCLQKGNLIRNFPGNHVNSIRQDKYSRTVAQGHSPEQTGTGVPS